MLAEDLRSYAGYEDLVTWLRNHPNLKTSKPEPVTLGGVSGQQLDVSVSNAPEDYSRDGCGPIPCVFLMGLASQLDILISEGDKARMITFEDVKGRTVVVMVGTRAEAFEGFIPKAQKVLDTVERKAES